MINFFFFTVIMTIITISDKEMSQALYRSSTQRFLFLSQIYEKEEVMTEGHEAVFVSSYSSCAGSHLMALFTKLMHRR